MTTFRRSLALGALLILAPAAARAAELLVFAAASLTDAMQELAKTWDPKTHNHTAFNFAGSNDLARQLKAGAPADVFFSADSARMDELEQAGLIDHAARHDRLSNTLVVVVPVDAKNPVKGPDDLPGVVHLALADPDAVPAGIYAKTWLQSRNLWDRVKDHVVPGVDVRATLAAVAGGNAEAGIVYKTDAAVSKQVRVAFEVPRAEGPKITYPVAPLRSSAKPATSELMRFLLSPEAAAVFERYGFIVLPAR